LPPGIPAWVIANLLVSLQILRWGFKPLKIACNDRDKIIMGSKISIMCYDKTGTLTQTGIDVNGMIDIKNPKKLIQNLDGKLKKNNFFFVKNY
jgi:magnesium-transporting ATPase (P-type)